MTTMPTEYEAQRDWVVDHPLEAHDEIVRLTDQLRKLTESTLDEGEPKFLTGPLGSFSICSAHRTRDPKCPRCNVVVNTPKEEPILDTAGDLYEPAIEANQNIRADDAHEWQGDWFRCTQCGQSMHCTKCGSGCGAQGHLVKDENDFYFHCQEPERWLKQLGTWTR